MLHAPRSANVGRDTGAGPPPTVRFWDRVNGLPASYGFVGIQQGDTLWCSWSNDLGAGREITGVVGAGATWARVIRNDLAGKLTEVWLGVNADAGNSTVVPSTVGNNNNGTTFWGIFSPCTLLSVAQWTSAAATLELDHATTPVDAGPCLSVAIARWSLDAGTKTDAPNYVPFTDTGRGNRDYAQYYSAASGLVSEIARMTHTTPRDNKIGTMVNLQGA